MLLDLAFELIQKNKVILGETWLNQGLIRALMLSLFCCAPLLSLVPLDFSLLSLCFCCTSFMPVIPRLGLACHCASWSLIASLGLASYAWVFCSSYLIGVCIFSVSLLFFIDPTLKTLTFQNQMVFIYYICRNIPLAYKQSYNVYYPLS